MSIHNFLNARLVLIATLALASVQGKAVDPPDAARWADTPMGTLVTAEWLHEHLDDPNLVVLDSTVIVEQDENGLREVNGRASYESGHIPGAGFADLMGDLSDADAPLSFTAPSSEEFAKAMGALGVGNDTRVVLYSAQNQAWAARVWWMLRWIGFDNAALLDGGLSAWKASGYPLSTEPAMRTARTLTPAVRSDLIADHDEVLAAVGDPDVRLVDAMPAPHYRGEMAMYDRPGHILGASNVSVTSLVDEAGKYRSLDELAELVPGDRGARSITYCGGGIAASSVAFTMVRLGFTDVAIYDGSLAEWAADPSNPMELSPDPEWENE